MTERLNKENKGAIGFVTGQTGSAGRIRPQLLKTSEVNFCNSTGIYSGSQNVGRFGQRTVTINVRLIELAAYLLSARATLSRASKLNGRFSPAGTTAISDRGRNRAST